MVGGFRAACEQIKRIICISSNMALIVTIIMTSASKGFFCLRCDRESDFDITCFGDFNGLKIER